MMDQGAIEQIMLAGEPSFQLLAASSVWSTAVRLGHQPRHRFEHSGALNLEDSIALVVSFSDAEVWLYPEPYDAVTVAYFSSPRRTQEVEWPGRGRPPYRLLDELAGLVVADDRQRRQHALDPAWGGRWAQRIRRIFRSKAV